MTGTNVLSGTITVSTASRINVDAGTLSLTNSTKALELTGALNIGGALGDIRISGPMSGAGALVKDGGSNTVLTLSGSSTNYTGNISVGTATTTAAGILKINTSVNALGTTSGTTTINNGSALQLEGGLSFAAEPTIIAGTGLTTEGVIRNVSGNNSYTGPITLTDASRINVDAGTLTLTSTATINTTSNAYSLTLGGATNMTASGIISGTGSLTKDGVHIIIGIQLDHILQMMLRDKIVSKIGEIWELPLINGWDAVFDEGISKGTTNWQMYGSRKPGNQAYELTQYYLVSYDSRDGEFMVEERKGDRGDINPNEATDP
jgi:hypothetical protein